MDVSRVRVVFMGSPAFAEPTLRALVREGYRIALVVTQPDRPAGRGGRVDAPPVKKVAGSLGLDVVQPATLRDPSAAEQIAAARADVFVVAAYGQIIPRSLLALPARGSLNVHASLLPRWRGASPVAAAILAGDCQTGVSIMEVAPRMDAGPVVAARSVPIGPGDTTGGLEARLADLGAELLVETIPAWFDRALESRPQDEAVATYCSLISKADGHVRASMSVQEAERAVRAYDPWPGAFVTYRGERLGIWKATAKAFDTRSGSPGELTVLGRHPAVALVDGWLILDEVQKQGGRRITGASFLNGERGELAQQVGLA